ncbi:MAG: hypothetical protein IT266_02880 [Saprospiraceae bacterium]|nr:hypothetical protein [Saprospiraceae bacterium]
MKITRSKSLCLILGMVAAIAFMVSCARHYYFRENYRDANALLHLSEKGKSRVFLKAHMRNGDVCILRDSWQIDSLREEVKGTGKRFNFNREMTYAGTLALPFDSISIYETNVKFRKPESNRLTALGIIFGLDLLVGLVCLVNPKACFGSCPTFYLNPEDHFHYADAEGFSSAISPSMEYADIDALCNKHVQSDSISLVMKNEALETHCIDALRLLVYPTGPGERVYQSPDDRFYLCSENHSAFLAQAQEGNVARQLASPDRCERFSMADPVQLNSKEEIILQFKGLCTDEEYGLLLHFRQSLMSTYLFYKALAYMGDAASDVFAALERDADLRQRFDTTAKLLGGIDVYTLEAESQTWELQSAFDETGPIAINRQMLPLKADLERGTLSVKLVLNKGLWRLDHAALVAIQREVQPMEIAPCDILCEGQRELQALSKMTVDGKHMITLPGNAYEIRFRLPQKNNRYELILYSKGYYLEWMRAGWIKEKDLVKLRQLIDDPESYLIGQTPEYKRYERQMEEIFWNSKIAAKSLSYDEN